MAPPRIYRTFGPIGLGTSPADLYNSNASIQDIVLQMHFANRTGAAAKASVWVGASGGSAAGTELVNGLSIPAHTAWDEYMHLQLGNADFVVGAADLANALSCYAMGERYLVPVLSGSGYPGVPAFVNQDIAVDGTNTTDETANISNTIAAAASGSSSVWRRFRLVPTGGTTVKISTAVQIATKHHFILDFNGCTLKTVAGAAFNQLTAGLVLGHGFGGFWDGGVTNFIITNGGLWQNNPSPGVYLLAREQQANIEIAGGTTSTPCHDGLIYNMTLQGAGGDCIKLGGTGDLTYLIDGYSNNCLNAGRMGYTVIYGHDHTWGTLGANTHGACGYACIDIEPNTGGTANDCTNIFVDNNSWSTWAQEFYAVNGSGTTYLFDTIKVRNNDITGSSLKTVMSNAASRPQNMEFTGNVSHVTVAGPVLDFAHIDHLKYLSPANTQPLSSGALASVVDCFFVT